MTGFTIFTHTFYILNMGVGSIEASKNYKIVI